MRNNNMRLMKWQVTFTAVAFLGESHCNYISENDDAKLQQQIEFGIHIMWPLAWIPTSHSKWRSEGKYLLTSLHFTLTWFEQIVCVKYCVFCKMVHSVPCWTCLGSWTCWKVESGVPLEKVCLFGFALLSSNKVVFSHSWKLLHR